MPLIDEFYFSKLINYYVMNHEQGLSHAANKLGGKDKLEGLIKDLNKTIFKN